MTRLGKRVASLETLDMSAQLNRHTKQGERGNQKGSQKASGTLRELQKSTVLVSGTGHVLASH